MKRPFNIFPSIGYRNSQFQIVTSVDNLKIDIYDQNNIIKSIEVNSKTPTLLTSISSTGKLIAKCNFNNAVFQQELEIKEAFRFGSSEFKKAFVFDNSEYSFFLMKDRLLLYDEKKRILLTENHYSPTEIYKINETNFLFVTKVGDPISGIINLGIYNLETFSMVSELLNDYREIKILPKSNKVWLFNIKSKKIQCFEIINQTNNYFTQLKIFENFKDFFLDSTSENIYIDYDNVLNLLDLNNLFRFIEIPKKSNNAIDKFGNVITIEDRTLNYTQLLTNYSETVKLDFEINILHENFIHVGNNLSCSDELKVIERKIEEIKNEVVESIPSTETYHNHILPEDQKISESYKTERIFPTLGGIFLVQSIVKKEILGVRFKKKQNIWMTTPNLTETTETSVFFINS